MSCRNLLPLPFIALLVWTMFASQCSVPRMMYVGFYNVENLFDTLDDPYKNDDYFTPEGPVQWTAERYKTKLVNLSKVINEMADGQAPAILGLCEVENLLVLQDLVKQDLLKDENYSIVHIESDDERGIDNAILYREEFFKPYESGVEKIDLEMYDDKTRDILWSKGVLENGDTLIVLVNHWPSRGGGQLESDPKRAQAAKTLRALVARMEAQLPNAAIVTMGDFNDEPIDNSIAQHLGATSSPQSGHLYNLMGQMDKDGLGSYCYRGNWNMLDQIMVNGVLFDGRGLEVDPDKTGIKSEDWLKQVDPDYYGYPLRTYGGRKYLGGYSDHFVVYTALILH